MEIPTPESDRLNAEEVARYSRHLTLPDVGLQGQLALRSASVLIVGVGGLGSPAGVYLAAAGVGRIGLVEFDRVELSNLQRQVLYSTADVGRSKIERARARLEEINPHVAVECHETRLDAANALQILRPYDVVVDGTDNFPTRYLVNDACVLLGKPNVYGSIFRFEGQVSVFWAPSGPCYRCLYPDPPPPGSVPNCAEGGVLGVLPGVIGAIQATEAIKLILDQGERLQGRLLLFDALEMRFREMKLRRDANCPVCGTNPTIRGLSDPSESCEAPPPPQEHGGLPAVHVEQLRDEIRAGGKPLLLDVRTAEEWVICHLDDALLIPIQQLPGRLAEVEREREIVVYCHVGGRSAMAVDFLLQQGFARVRNLVGGIDAWSERIDPTLPRY